MEVFTVSICQHFLYPSYTNYVFKSIDRRTMIQDDIINELQYIPEAKLIELYDLIHYFRLGLNSESAKQIDQEAFKIDKAMCLKTLEKIKRGDFSSFSEIDDIDAHIESLKNEVN